jgi:hypothetical protein
MTDDLYRIHVWEPAEGQPLPSSTEAAVACLVEMRRAPAGVRQRFRGFVRDIARSVPALLPASAEYTSEWDRHQRDPLLSGHADCGVYTVALDWAAADRDAYAVVSAALYHRLCVADEAGGCFHLTDGQTLALPRGSRLRDARALPTRDEVLDGACAALRPLLQHHGLRESAPEAPGRYSANRVFRREGPEAWHALHVRVAQRYAQLHVDVALSCGFPAVNALLWAAQGQVAEREQLAQCTLHLAHSQWFAPQGTAARDRDDRSLVVVRPSELRPALRELADAVSATLSPLIEASGTVRGLDRVLNTEPTEASPLFTSYVFGSANLLVAHLAGNPRTLTLCDEYLKAGLRSLSKPHVFPQGLRTLGKCIDYVRRKHGYPAMAEQMLTVPGLDKDVFMSQSLKA